MLWKSLLTGTLLAGLAGAVVYFGTGGEFATASVKADFRQAATETKAATKSVAEDVSETASATIEKMTNASDSLEASLKDKLASGENVEPPKTEIQTKDSQKTEKEKSEKKWLDRYLNKKSGDEALEADSPDQEPVNVDDMDSEDVDGAVRDILRKDRENTAEEKAGENRDLEEAPKLDPVPRLEMSSTENETDTVIKSETEIKAVYETALDETKDIKIVELRDRAYLSLIDYTIRKKDFERSKAVITEISQPELRDTARSNIAVGLARLGEREPAFAILEDVETDALSDVLRLQVIEAMTAPSQNQANSAIPTN